VYAPGWLFFKERRVDIEKNSAPDVGFHVKPRLIALSGDAASPPGYTLLFFFVKRI
jgi:hypothetical protein